MIVKHFFQVIIKWRNCFVKHVRSEGEGLVNFGFEWQSFRNGYLRFPFHVPTLENPFTKWSVPRFGPWDIPDTWDTIKKPGCPRPLRLVSGNHHWFFRREDLSSSKRSFTIFLNGGNDFQGYFTPCQHLFRVFVPPQKKHQKTTWAVFISPWLVVWYI